MHPFNFSKTVSFTCPEPDSAFVFEPLSGKFHWYGSRLDKLGKYLVIEKDNQVIIELEYNFAREESYTLTSAEGFGDELITFAIKSRKTGNLYSFFRT